jgi:3-methyladenine DNA glycosylase AlkC
MAEPLKHLFNERVVRALARELRVGHPRLRERAFVSSCMQGLGRLELSGRAWHIAEVMRDHLPTSFDAAADALIASFGPELGDADHAGLSPLRYMPHVFFIQKYGLDDFEAAMRVQYELTKRFSAEWSIRAFLLKYPEATYARLLAWTTDDNVHVRRLVSEGTRPRLPWAPRLRAFQSDPAPVLALLERLKDDPDRYVQRSVANSLNDIGKDHPDRLVDTCRRWTHDAPPGRRWIIAHACRSLVKAGHRDALDLMGAGARPKARIDGVRIVPRRVHIGSSARFSFRLVSTSTKAQVLLVDYRVHFVKAKGGTSPKVFKMKKVVLEPRAAAEFSGRVSFRQMTTRRHYPGRHRIELLVNGVAYPLGAVDVRS